MNKMNSIKKLTFTGILTALGVILMLIEIPYPLVPFLRFDASDIVVLIAFVTLGIIPALIIAALKSLVHFLTFGPVGPAAIGQTTAFLAASSFVIFYWIYGKCFQNKYLRSIMMILSVTLVMTILNYLFITPIWFGGTTFVDVQSWVNLESFSLPGNLGYLETILIVYIPFNLLKGVLVTIIFELVNTSLGKYINRIFK